MMKRKRVVTDLQEDPYNGFIHDTNYFDYWLAEKISLLSNA